METIYTKIIWDVLGKKDYKLHKEEPQKTEKLILDWIKSTPLEKVDEILFKDCSWLDKVTAEDYYDGFFYGFSQEAKDTESQKIMIHDMGMLPTLLHMAIKVKFAPSELRFMADILEAYYEKLPKDTTCSTQIETGVEL